MRILILNRVPTVENELSNVKPITSNNFHFVDLRDDGFVTVRHPNQEHMDFWDQLHAKYEKILEDSATMKKHEL